MGAVPPMRLRRENCDGLLTSRLLVRFLTVEEVLDMHDETILRFGGERGLRHRGGVEAALERARHGPFSTGDIAERAAFILRGIVQDHPFVDGNKRAGFQAAETFLRWNGSRIEAPRADVVSFMLGVARGTLDLDDISGWLRARLATFKSPDTQGGLR